MPTRHVIVDGSNLATEGRTKPSLRQLHEAVDAYRSDHPDALISVIVDATFGHRIDAKEVAEFDALIERNEIVAPPAGAVGRGDAFVLAVAHKVKATVLSNDSYQEFHGTYTWLFDHGRLVGGKPVPHVGWVFVERTPVRGPVSRKAVKEAKTADGGRPARATKASAAASAPMPTPTTPPPGKAAKPQTPVDAPKAPAAAAAAPSGTVAPSGAAPSPSAPKRDHGNSVLGFLGFVEQHPVGSLVEVFVESYSSHGAYVSIGDVVAYAPLRLLGDPAPKSAREVLSLGATVSLEVAEFHPSRRSIDLRLPADPPAASQSGNAPIEPSSPESAPAATPRKRAAKRSPEPAAKETPSESATLIATDTGTDAPTRKPSKRAGRTVPPPAQATADPLPSPAPAKKRAAKAAEPVSGSVAAPLPSAIPGTDDSTAAPATKARRGAPKAAAPAAGEPSPPATAKASRIAASPPTEPAVPSPAVASPTPAKAPRSAAKAAASATGPATAAAKKAPAKKAAVPKSPAAETPTRRKKAAT